jgi:hypothetical protein
MRVQGLRVGKRPASFGNAKGTGGLGETRPLAHRGCRAIGDIQERRPRFLNGRETEGATRVQKGDSFSEPLTARRVLATPHAPAHAISTVTPTSGCELIEGACLSIGGVLDLVPPLTR